MCEDNKKKANSKGTALMMLFGRKFNASIAHGDPDCSSERIGPCIWDRWTSAPRRTRTSGDARGRWRTRKRDYTSSIRASSSCVFSPDPPRTHARTVAGLDCIRTPCAAATMLSEQTSGRSRCRDTYEDLIRFYRSRSTSWNAVVWSTWRFAKTTAGSGPSNWPSCIPHLRIKKTQRWRVKL